MNLFEGLEKFGLQAQNVGNLFEEEKKLREDIKKLEEEKENLNSLINNLITKEAVQKEREIAAGENFTKRVEEFTQSTKELEKLKNRLRETQEFLLNLSAKTKEFSINGMEIILKSHKDNLNKKSSLITKLEILCADLDISFDANQFFHFALLFLPKKPAQNILYL